MRVHRHRLPPPKTHETYTIGHLWSHALQLQDLLVSSSVSFSSALLHPHSDAQVGVTCPALGIP